MNQKKRIDWIDAAKGIAILAVMYSHLLQGLNIDQGDTYGLTTWPALTLLYSWHLPIFFIISGYLFSGDNKSFKDFFIRKCKGILLPYLILGLLTVFLSWAAWDFPNLAILGKEYIPELLIQNRYNTIWYLTCLFLAEIVFFFIIKLARGNRWAQVIIVAVIVAAGLTYYKLGGVELPWNADVVPFACMFMMVGYIARQIQVPQGKVFFIIALIANPLLAFINVLITGMYLEMFRCSYSFLPLTLASAIAGTYVVIKIASKFKPKWLTFLGRNSLIYFGLHQVISIPVWETLCKSTGFLMERGILNAILYNVLGMAFILVTMTIVIYLYMALKKLCATIKKK